jgi:hypothetical protein
MARVIVKSLVTDTTFAALQATVSTNTSDISTINNPTKSLSTNGHSILPGGLIVQWGTVSLAAGSGSVATLTFPRSFPTACQSVTLNCNFGVAGTSAAYVTAKSTTTASLQRANNANLDGGTSFFWIAVGY